MLQSQDQTYTNERMLLRDEQRKLFLKMESPPGENAMETFKMTTKDLKYYISLVDRAVVGFERLDSNFERSSTVDKMLSE